MIKIELDSIPDGSSHVELVEDAGELEVPDDSGIASFESPLRLSLDIVRSSSEIVIRGKAGVEVALDCARCLKHFTTSVEAPLNIMCTFGELASDEAGGCLDGVVEIRANARSIDITGEVRSELLVRLPVKPLCESACKGLCPVCG